MKHTIFFKTKSKTFFSFIVVLFTNVFNLNAQGTAAPYNGLGPTLIISSKVYPVNQAANVYDYSKLGIFETSGYDIVTVGDDDDGTWNGTDSGHRSFAYLNEAINLYLSWNYRRIIILEGVYKVNAPIIIDQIGGTTANAKAIGKITIEGEGFATRITNAPTYLTGAIFDVKSSYNTLKNMSIIS